jgi:hypothetical protein
MQTISYLRWSPARSPLAIEFSASLVQDVAITSGDEANGVLYGTRAGPEVRLAAARPCADGADPALSGLSVVGIFAHRASGEVFLTESDLERFEASRTDVALVVAGERGGFFVRESGGAVQAVRSHEEFSIRHPVPVQPVQPKPRPAPVRRPQPAPVSVPSRPSMRFQWIWAGAAATLLLMIPLCAFAYLRPLLPERLNVQLSERDGQLIVSWNPKADTAGGQIEILDGSKRTAVTLLSGQSHATFPIRSGDMLATVRTNPDHGPDRSETAHLVSQTTTPVPNPEGERVREEVALLEIEAASLRKSVAENETRIAELNRSLQAYSSTQAQ